MVQDVVDLEDALTQVLATGPYGIIQLLHSETTPWHRR